MGFDRQGSQRQRKLYTDSPYSEGFKNNCRQTGCGSLSERLLPLHRIRQNKPEKANGKTFKKKKKIFWHIDYLRNQADHCMALPIRSTMPLEHELAKSLNNISDWSIPGFGSSDCSCETHLFGMQNNPIYDSVDLTPTDQKRFNLLNIQEINENNA
jgi:hypothetical protein